MIPSVPFIHRCKYFALPAFLICLLTGIVYAKAVWQNDFVTWDDGLLIYENPLLKTFSWHTVSGMFTSYDPELYIPFTLLSYSLDRMIGGLNPLVFHLTNLLLHMTNACLGLWALQKILRSHLLAFALALLFALHPLHTEAVLWASARKDVLSAFFFLASLVAYMTYRERKTTAPYIVSILLFLCALLAKVVAIPLPFILLLMDTYERRPSSRRMFIEKIPYFVLATIFAIVAVGGKEQVLERTGGIIPTVLMACKSVLFLLTKFLIPHNLSPLYPFDGKISITSVDFFFPVLLLCGIAVALWYASRLSKGMSLGALFFVLTFAPSALNFSKAGDLYIGTDRYLYIPSIGLLLIVGSLLLSLRGTMKEKAVRVGSTALIVIAGIFAILSHVQSGIWRDSVSLYTHALTITPDFPVAHNNLGAVYLDQRRFDEALMHLRRAVELRPTYIRAHNNLINAYMKMGKTQEALRQLSESAKYSPAQQELYEEILQEIRSHTAR